MSSLPCRMHMKALHVQVGAHPKEHRLNAMGKATAGPGLVQIWAVQHQPCDGREKAALPRMCLGLCHDRGIVREALWCPSAEAGQAASTLKMWIILFDCVSFDSRVDVLYVATMLTISEETCI